MNLNFQCLSYRDRLSLLTLFVLKLIFLHVKKATLFGLVPAWYLSFFFFPILLLETSPYSYALGVSLINNVEPGLKTQSDLLVTHDYYF